MKIKASSQVFYIPKESLSVNDILNGVSNKSEYICAAIIEKHKRDNGYDPAETLKATIKEVLSEMYPSGIKAQEKPSQAPQRAETKPEPQEDSSSGIDKLKSVFAGL